MIKYFDIYQKILLILGIVSIVLSIVFQSIMTTQANIIYDNEGLIESIEFPFIFQTLYSICFFLNVFCIGWFIIRSITFQLRKKEASR